MILDNKMLQELANKIISDIGYNINIIDENGIIVASGSKHRIGTYHAAGHLAAKKEERIDITSDDEYQGVKCGINQPFYYDNNLVGVIGITGNTQTISDFVNIVKAMIEIMVEQEMLKKQIFIRQTNKTHFANLLVNINSNDDLLLVKKWGKKLNYNFDIPRNLILLDLGKDYEKVSYSNILYEIKKLKEHSRDDFSSIIANKLLLLKTIKEPKINILDNKELNSYVNSIYNSISSKLGVKPKIAIASYYKDIFYYKRAFDEALYVLDKIDSDKDYKVDSINSYLNSYVLSKLPDNFLSHYTQDIYKALENKEILIQTLSELSKHNMNLVETSNSLNIHRNTIISRLDTIYKLTDIDFRNNKKYRQFCSLLY